MNCDEAFDALTAGQDARETDEFERHLNMCPRCRQMRDVLSPALSLFEPFDGIATGESSETRHSDPADTIRQQFLSVEAVQMARETAQRLSAIGQKKAQTRLRPEAKWLIVQIAAAAGAVALVFSLFAPIASGPERRQSAAGAAGTVSLSQCLWQDRTRSDNSQADSQTIVSSCVACHFDTKLRVR